MDKKIIVVNDYENFNYIFWEFQNKPVKIDLQGKKGSGVYSQEYDVIVVLIDKPAKESDSLDMRVYTPNGSLKNTIQPSSEKLWYSYIREQKLSKSGVAVVASTENETDEYIDWQYEIDLDNFTVGKKLVIAR